MCDRKNNPDVKFFNKYSKNGCIAECYRQEILGRCKCVPFSLIIDYELETERECSPTEVMSCANLELRKFTIFNDFKNHDHIIK